MLSEELLEEIATDAMLTERIVDRAEKLKALNMDRTVACAFIVMAKSHYDLDLEAMLNGSDFDFLHDFTQMPQYFHKETGSFDDRFLPRFSKKSLN